jgi:hypothetical protein
VITDDETVTELPALKLLPYAHTAPPLRSTKSIPFYARDGSGNWFVADGQTWRPMEAPGDSDQYRIIGELPIKLANPFAWQRVPPEMAVRFYNLPEPYGTDDLLAGRVVGLYRVVNGGEVEFHAATARDAALIMDPTTAELDAIGVSSRPIVDQTETIARNLRALKERGDL